MKESRYRNFNLVESEREFQGLFEYRIRFLVPIAFRAIRRDTSTSLFSVFLPILDGFWPFFRINRQLNVGEILQKLHKTCPLSPFSLY